MKIKKKKAAAAARLLPVKPQIASVAIDSKAAIAVIILGVNLVA